MKFCRTCERDLPLSAFGRDKYNRDGLTIVCRECRLQQTKKWQTANPDAAAKWRKANLVKFRGYTAKWRAANPEKAAAYSARSRADGRANAATKRWNERNKEKLSVQRRTPEHRAKARANSRRWVLANPQRERERDKRYKGTEKRKLWDRAYQSNRRARKRSLPGNYTTEDIKRLLAASNKCHICKRSFTTERKPTVDHVMAIATDLGSNDPGNLTLVCLSCNSKKRDKRFNPLTGQGLLV